MSLAHPNDFIRPPTPRPSILSLSLKGLLIFLALPVGLFSLRYVMPDPFLGSPEVMANPFAPLAIAWHAGTACAALLVGPFQFFRPKGRRAAWHRVMGAIYMAACLASAPAGFILALGSTAGPLATAGFGSLAVVWFYVNARGLHAVLSGRYAEHGRWMTRSYALTFGAVTLRLMLLGGMLTGAPNEIVYVASSFLSWIPNLILVELWFAWRRAYRTALQPS